MTAFKYQKNISQIDWNKTPIFDGGIYGLRQQCNNVCGDLVFGKGKSKSKEVFKTFIDFIEKSSHMKAMKTVPSGDIVLSPPTKDYCVTKLKNMCDFTIKNYNSYHQTKVTDLWASKLKSLREGDPINMSDPTQNRIWKNGGKRFVGKKLSLREQIIEIVTNSRGMLAEGHVISFLNSGLQCPECGQIGKIGWCDGNHRSVNSFRDAVCTNCIDNNVITLFEIKTRWDTQNKTNSTYAGSFPAINTLMTLNANVYLVIASRDTGDVRIGKITNSSMCGNKKWMYSIQEGLGWGNPSSYVKCKDGMFKIPVPMTPLEETMNQQYLNYIYKQVLVSFESIQ